MLYEVLICLDCYTNVVDKCFMRSTSLYGLRLFTPVHIFSKRLTLSQAEFRYPLHGFLMIDVSLGNSIATVSR